MFSFFKRKRKLKVGDRVKAVYHGTTPDKVSFGTIEKVDKEPETTWYFIRFDDGRYRTLHECAVEKAKDNGKS